VYIPNAEFLGMEIEVNALPLFLFCGRRFSFRSGCLLIRAGDRNEIPIEQLDDFGIGERTRSQAKSPTSTTAGIDLAVVEEQEDGTVGLLGEFLGAEDTGGPSNLVEALFGARGLDIADLLFHRTDEFVVLDPSIGSDGYGGQQNE
jgi:hypothetical protein